MCSGKVVVPERSLAAVAPHLVAEWIVSANGLEASEVAPQSNTDFWWKCPVAPDHVWHASPNNRYGKGSGCPFCAGQRSSSTNNLTLLPHVLRFWDQAENGRLGVYPQDCTLHSKKQVYWLCPRGEHSSSRQSVQKRVQGQGCRDCAGHRVTHTNSLQRMAPELARELDIVATGRTPDEVSIGENQDVHWICPVEPEWHRWPASPNNRFGGKTGCPQCNTPGQSAQELRLMAELQAILAVAGYEKMVRVEGKSYRVDFASRVGETKLIVEFDGSYWHRNTQVRDRQKSQELRDAGWTVVRVRESKLDVLDEPWDVVVPHLAPAFESACVVLEHLANLSSTMGLGLVDFADVEAYLRRGVPVAATVAQAAIDAAREKYRQRGYGRRIEL